MTQSVEGISHPQQQHAYCNFSYSVWEEEDTKSSGYNKCYNNGQVVVPTRKEFKTPAVGTTTMCKPQTNGTTGTARRCRVIIAGAGPAGLLLTALLMQRNAELPEPLYDITLVDARRDFGQVTQAELKASYRSWMLGLAGHGCDALRTCEGLYEGYCKEVGIKVESFSIRLGSKEFSSASPAEVPEGFIVDRNFIVAAIARFVRDRKEDSEGADDSVTTLYEHKLMYVDHERRRVLVRPNKKGTTTTGATEVGNDEDTYLPYDLLIGCDGVRSVVREAMVKRHSNFEMDIGDIFQEFKAVHVRRPPSVKESSLHLLPACFPNMAGIALPETGDMLNVSVGYPRHLYDELPEELKSDDPDVVAAYFEKNWKCFELVDVNDFARQWAGQRWNRTGQVHCNFYHSSEMSVVLMGDAAHATSPSIGMGMNQALRDAQVFYRLLQDRKDDLTRVLPEFSELRVKEGNSLSDMAMHLYCLDTKAQMAETLHQIVRGTLHRYFPWAVAEHPQSMIGLPEYDLSDVYNRAHELGIIGKHRRINQEIRQSHFERTTGMVKAVEKKKKKDDDEKTASAQMKWTRSLMVGSALLAAGSVVYAKMSKA